MDVNPKTLATREAGMQTSDYFPSAEIVRACANSILGRPEGDDAMYTYFERCPSEPNSVYCYRKAQESACAVPVEITRQRQGKSLFYLINTEHLGFGKFSSSQFPEIAELGRRAFHTVPRFPSLRSRIRVKRRV